jgi:hypothetical protein
MLMGNNDCNEQGGEVDEIEAEDDDNNNNEKEDEDEDKGKGQKSKLTKNKSKQSKMDPEILDVINTETRGFGCHREPFLQKFNNSKSSKW